MSKPTPPPMPNQDEPETSPWQYFLYGAGCLGLAVVVFLVLHNMEESGSGGRVHWLIALLYRIGGKWTATALFGVLGIIFFIMGIVGLSKRE